MAQIPATRVQRIKQEEPNSTGIKLTCLVNGYNQTSYKYLRRHILVVGLILIFA